MVPAPNGSKSSIPVGHRNRREEGIPLLEAKFKNSLNKLFDTDQSASILNAFSDADSLDQISVAELMGLLVRKAADVDQLLA